MKNSLDYCGTCSIPRARFRRIFPGSIGAFFDKFRKQDAVLRRFEIVGEAASRVSPETQALFPNLPFRGMRGMRNIIAHDYGEVDLDQVWTTVTTDLPGLISSLDGYFADNA